MAERYRKVYSLPENLYTPGSPVLIAAGALYKDNQTGTILAQLKFRNLSKKNIIAVKVTLSAYDVFGRALEGVSEYQYLDLNAPRDTAFGDGEATPMPDPVTRVFVPGCTAVVFADGSLWTAPADAEWVSLPGQPGIYNQLGDLMEQYQRDTSTLSRFIPLNCYDLWFCSCGAINHEGESHCHSCHQEKAALFAALNRDVLLQRKQDYEKEKAEQVARKAEAAKKRLMQISRFAKPAAIVAGIAAAILTVTFLIPGFVSPFFQYREACSLMRNGNYPEAIAAFEAMDGYKDSAEMISECYYQEAHTYLDTNNVLEAITLLESLGDYKDSAEKADSLRHEYPLACAQIGDCFPLGTYEQDNNTANGSEAVEWIVLDIRDNKVLLVSKYVLDSKPFHNTEGTANWATASIREWLNKDFISGVFTAEEQSLICTTEIPEETGSSGSATQDKLFLLSYEEVQSYLSTGASRLCEATDYAVAQGAITNSGTNSSRWLLRTNGKSDIYISIVAGHNIKRSDYQVSDTGLGVRPAMWVDLP